MSGDFVFTSESVTAGHPDKLCDVISDALVDRFLQRDPFARVDTQCAVSRGLVFVAANFASPARVDIPELVRSVVHEVGYRQGEFNSRDCAVLTSVAEGEVEPWMGVDEGELDEQGLEGRVATHQGTFFGYACRETAALMPLPIVLAHRLARRLAQVREDGVLPYLCPDAKTQVAVEYHGGLPVRLHSVTLVPSLARGSALRPEALEAGMRELVLGPCLEEDAAVFDDRSLLFVNPDGPVYGGGPALHAGLTGRKTAVDTYGEYARHSGAALSGKDPGRIDRIAAYAARHAAKNVVAAGLADQCEVQLSYTIGMSRPVSVRVQTFGTGRLDEEEVRHRLQAALDLRLAGIIRRFGLRRLASRPEGLFRPLAAYGQVGRTDLGLPWEDTDLADGLR